MADPDSGDASVMRPARSATAAVAVAVLAGAGGSAVAQTSRPGTLPRTWVHHTDVDGDGVTDRVTIVRGDDLHVSQGMGSGHYTVRVALSSGGHVAKRLNASYYYSARQDPWTPWFGATQIDHHRGKELLLGYTSGAHAVVFHMLTYRSGRLRVLLPPSPHDDQGGWLINSSVGTGSQGWKCTDRGVMSRNLYPNGKHTAYVIDRASFVFNGSWQRTAHVHRTVPADANGQPPAYTDSYASFACRGLPSRW